ncbi:hypothetical protein ACTODO_00100 [Schaalia dentiphila ATCC 17982]|uniref:Uncharacterized protein n=1 Tax=Schaalia dentiphila ATCC 17982 TaxID=411466 RepID=A7B901_9ACTO|nr:hypothetical protein ACTODO_00100 [Schaalia odontolytica ATCC 17982]
MPPATPPTTTTRMCGSLSTIERQNADSNNSNTANNTP